MTNGVTMSTPVIYVDGAFEFGKMGLGVYCDDPEIRESELIEGSGGTNNVAECMALGKALEIAAERKIIGAQYLSDSQLVVYWVSGQYALKSHTAQTYIPQLRTMLKDVQGRLNWIPGSTNKADALSRQHFPTRSTMSFKSALRIKVPGGRDEFSAMRLEALVGRIAAEDCIRITTAFGSPKDQATAMRWRLRGLSIDDAIRKVQVSIEISQHIARKQEQQYEDENYISL